MSEHTEKSVRETYEVLKARVTQPASAEFVQFLWGKELLGVVADSRDPGYVADYIAQNTMLRHQDKQVILEELRPMVRLQRVNELLAREIDIINFEQEIEGKIRIKARAQERFFLNYCTFGYTMPWWQWRDWERLIDWMALNGVNMPLAITGQESVWLRVWTRLGLPADTVRAYFTGPAHLPWHRMTNFDHFQGPLPDSYLNHQEQLQKQIVARERELGMTLVLPAFAGHVPEALVRFYPKAKITRMSSWGGFRDDYRSYFLDPLDSLFGVIQHAFLEE